ncbi:MAG TPA: M3 family metallopeptidase [Candidatus Eisenbacteria bacterium]|nr:M3 family metallopeptidase [Candidatus Eisenbacteria bacterium]
MREFKSALAADIAAVRKRAGAMARLSQRSGASWERIVLDHEDLIRRMSHLGSYINCLASADARNEAYRKEEAELTRLRAEMAKIRIELLRVLKDASEATFTRFLSRPALKGADNYLTRAREEARRSMPRDKEVLAADLAVDGLQAWGRLYETLSAKLEFDMEFPDGRSERLPMAQRRSLLDHPDRRIRRAAFEKGNAAWATIEDAAAAALNAIAGARLTLNRHRGVTDFLEIALFQAGISRATLDALLEGLFSRLEIPRRILRLHARAMGENGIAWYDLGAPLLPQHDSGPETGDRERDSRRKTEASASATGGVRAAIGLPWEDATALVARAFSNAYPALGSFFHTVIDKKWVDWEPRPAKRPGGFCTGSMLTGESRVFMTYNRSVRDVLTLAHEAGHAFHGHLMRDVRPYARAYPMTLAETASTFSELILVHGLLDDGSIGDEEKTRLLDMEAGYGAVYLLDVPARYEFEKAFYEERKTGELSVSRLKTLMAETQRRVLGDALVDGGEDPCFWISKLHFYITGLTFYNFPYTFGFLLSRGLYAMFEREREGFLPKYEALLRSAGSDTPENVVRKTVGCNLQRPDFWAQAVETLEQPIDRLERRLDQLRDSGGYLVPQA